MTAKSTVVLKWGVDLKELPHQALRMLADACEVEVQERNQKDKRDRSNKEHFTLSVVRIALADINAQLDAITSGKANAPEVSDAEAVPVGVKALETMGLAIAAQVAKLLKAHRKALKVQRRRR